MRYAPLTALFLLIAIAAPVSATAQLPNLYQETPYALGVQAVNSPEGTRYHLGFGATVYNFGRGPLTIEGSRPSTAVPQMDATQVVTNSDGSSQRYPNVGKLEYVDAITHRHWHYLRFNTYALRSLKGTVVVPDQKTGFCVGDRVVAHEFETLPGQPPAPVFTGGCGFDEPGLLSVSEGISVNYADPYGAHVEGQFVDITKIAKGRYELVHHVNADQSLHETDYSDNEASVLIAVSYPSGPTGAPKVVQLMRCDLSGKCPAAPVMTRADAVPLAKRAFRKAYGERSVSATCEPKGVTATCTGSWRGGSGAVTIAYKVARGKLSFTYAATARGKKPARGSQVLPFTPTPVPVTPAA